MLSRNRTLLKSATAGGLIHLDHPFRSFRSWYGGDHIAQQVQMGLHTTDMVLLR